MNFNEPWVVQVQQRLILLTNVQFKLLVALELQNSMLQGGRVVGIDIKYIHYWVSKMGGGHSELEISSNSTPMARGKANRSYNIIVLIL